MFTTLCYLLNRLGWAGLPALLRRMLMRVFRPVLRWGHYAQPTAGYTGWARLPGLGVLAFRATDGTLQYRW